MSCHHIPGVTCDNCRHLSHNFHVADIADALIETVTRLEGQGEALAASAQAYETALARIAELEAVIRNHRDEQGDYANSADRDLHEVLKETNE